MLRQKAVLLAWLMLSLAPAGGFPQAPVTPSEAPRSAAQPTGVQPSVDRPAQSQTATPVPRSAAAKPPSPAQNAETGGPDNAGSNPQQPQIIVTSPPPAPVEWNWHDRVLWGAYVVLAVLGYIAVMVGLRTLKSIERQTESSLATSKAALGSAAAALLRTQAVVEAERPWIVVTVEPFLTMENSFKVMATNRGRTPAQLTATIDQISVAADETQLPEEPQFEDVEGNSLPAPVILLPGESVGIRPFTRDEVNSICKTKEEFERIELWEEKLFLYGKVTYRDLVVTANREDHETIWCCRYIHGESKSALVITGPPAYNRHS